MPVWSRLYATIWLVFIQIWLAYTPVAPPVPYYLHIALGLALVGLTYANATSLRASTVPGRIKRVANASFGLAVLVALLGVGIAFHLGGSVSVALGLTLLDGLRFLHFVNAMAILAQAGAVAIAYDMWEEKEFQQATRPGEVPPAPQPA